MKKLLILGLVFSVIGIYSQVFAEEAAEKVAEKPSQTQTIKNAIEKYKAKNYIGCISDLKLVTDEDPSAAVAWYYLGNSYMNIAMLDEAHAAFETVIDLNTVPKLTSYSIQAKMCMENPASCEYQNFNYDEIQQLKADPVKFIEDYLASKNEVTQTEEEIEILELINRRDRMHPNAKDFIMNEQFKIQQNLKSDAFLGDPNSALAMYVENDNADKYAELLEAYRNAGGNKKVTPEMLQYLMMQNSMQNF